MVIILKGSNKTALIDDKGAQLISYRDGNNKEYIWNRDAAYWNESSPILFPMIGNLRDGKTKIGENIYEIPKHGFVKDKLFTVVDKSENMVTLLHESNEETLKVYPFNYKLFITYTLDNESLIMDMKVKNTDIKEMYYLIGGHPGFNCPLNEGEQFEDYILKFEHPENTLSPIYNSKKRCFEALNVKKHLNNSDTIQLNYSLFNNDALVFTNIRSKKVSLINKNTSKGIEVSFPDFNTIAFWTPSNKKSPFICFEPWNGSAIFDDEDDTFANKRDIQKLMPLNEKNYRIKIRLV